MRLRLDADLLRRALVRPEPILAFLVLLASAYYFLSGRSEVTPPATEVSIRQPQPQASEEAEVRLVLFDSAGLETPVFATIALPQSPGARVAAILAELRERSLDDPWPSELPVPLVYVENIDRRNVAVLDFRPREVLAMGVEEERRLLRSLEETLLANGVDATRFLLHGEAAGVFLEHLSVRSDL